MTVKIKRIKVTICICTRCGGSWRARFARIPLKCLYCKSPYWNQARTRKVRTVAAKFDPKAARPDAESSDVQSER